MYIVRNTLCFVFSFFLSLHFIPVRFHSTIEQRKTSCKRIYRKLNGFNSNSTCGLHILIVLLTGLIFFFSFYSLSFHSINKRKRRTAKDYIGRDIYKSDFNSNSMKGFYILVRHRIQTKNNTPSTCLIIKEIAKVVFFLKSYFSSPPVI